MPRAAPPKMTKVVCTLGPACRSAGTLARMVAAGMDVARLNLAHGTLEQHARDARAVREAARKAGRTVALMADLAGPKIRVGEIRGDVVHLRSGARFTLTTRAVMGDESIASVTYDRLPRDVRRGDRVLLADGSIELHVRSTSGQDVVCEVVDGGHLSSHKGVNLPTATVSAPALTAKDREDLAFAVDLGVDFLSLSFVSSAADMRRAKRLLDWKDADTPLVAKIERHEALDNIDAILKHAAGIMVARGDLGVETPLENIAMVQKTLIRRANAAGKPVITATQMLRSMVDEPMPTRAEATDVANAVLDGTDAVMLSEETAVGRYPVQAVDYISRITRNAEAALHSRADRTPAPPGVEGALARAAVTVAAEVGAAAIIAPTLSGTTPRMVSRFRAPCPIIAATPAREVERRLALTWGVFPSGCEDFTGTDQMLAEGERAALRTGLVRRGDLAVFATVAMPKGKSGTTNLVKVKRAE